MDKELLYKQPNDLSGDEWIYLLKRYKEEFGKGTNSCRCNVKGVQRKLKIKLGYESK